MVVVKNHSQARSYQTTIAHYNIQPVYIILNINCFGQACLLYEDIYTYTNTYIGLVKTIA